MTSPPQQNRIAVLERGILELLRKRTSGKTICPSEVARAQGGADWRCAMSAVREAAWRLAERGEVVILKRGRPVDRASARGTIRIGRGQGESQGIISSKDRR